MNYNERINQIVTALETTAEAQLEYASLMDMVTALQYVTSKCLVAQAGNLGALPDNEEQIEAHLTTLHNRICEACILAANKVLRVKFEYVAPQE